MKTALVVVLILILGIIGIWYFTKDENNLLPPNDINNGEPLVGTTTESVITKEFRVEGSSFKFSPVEMRVNEGDTVKVVFVNIDGTHDWKLDGYNIGTKVLQAGEQETVEFVANKPGSFEYFCSVGNHRAMGMKGTLVVE